MHHRRQHAVVAGLLLCLPVAALGAPSASHLVDFGVPGGHDPRSTIPVTRPDRGRPVQISGSVRTLLSPGVSAPIELRFKNASAWPVTIRRVEARIVRITAPHADATHPCMWRDFVIRQMPHQALRIPHGRVVDLTDLRVEARRWPTLGMRNRPVNQDGCKEAQLTLGFRALGTKKR